MQEVRADFIHLVQRNGEILNSQENIHGGNKEQNYFQTYNQRNLSIKELFSYYIASVSTY